MVDQYLDLLMMNLLLDGRFIRRRDVYSLRDGFEVGIGRDQVQPQGRREIGKDAFGRSNRSAVVFRLDGSNQIVVLLQTGGQEGLRRLVKGGGINRVERFQIVADFVRHRGHVVRVVPHMRIVALVLAVEIAHIQFFARASRIGLQKLIGPGVIAGTVDDDVLGIGHRPRIRSSRLVAMRVSIGIDNNAGNMHVAGTDLGGDIAPKILRRDDLHRPTAARGGLEGGPTSGKGQKGQ